MNFRIGFGYDVHQLSEGYDLTLGGINIPHTKGSVGHSDADVLIHVICDALLGAANLRDIGYHFPDTDPKYKNIDSKKLLIQVINLLQGKGYSVGNIDSTVCLQEPKIKSLIPNMIKCLSETMQIEEENISVKATTTERMGFTGREEGIEAYAVVLIYKN
jgi:2-C-methyl-D-erythritol 2,4-cyclodiphosphate synthase